MFAAHSQTEAHAVATSAERGRRVSFDVDLARWTQGLGQGRADQARGRHTEGLRTLIERGFKTMQIDADAVT
jgi:hypothetical protein